MTAETHTSAILAGYIQHNDKKNNLLLFSLYQNNLSHNEEKEISPET